MPSPAASRLRIRAPRAVFAVPSAGLLAAGLLTAALAALCGGCTPGGDERAEHLRAVARWEDRRLAPADSLAAMLNGPDAHVRLAAVRAAGLIGRDDALPGLVAALDDRSLTIRCAAAWALGLLADPAAAPALEKAGGGPNPTLREAALAALAHVPHDGAWLLQAAAAERPHEAALAWDALRNQAARVDSTALRDAILAGLTYPEPEVRWRVLRCAEVAPDTTLLAALAPFARSAHVQERVHAYRALARLGGDGALRAVAGGQEHLGDFRGRDRVRVRVAACRALGVLARPLAAPETPAGSDDRLESLGALLIAAAGDEHPHLAQTALDAMAALVADAPLPPEAAAQESLLPVWRIRLARAAARHLEHQEAQVRAAAAAARAALRGAGALPELRARCEAEQVPFAGAALIGAIGAVQPAPWPEPAFPDLPCAPHSLLSAAALDAFAARRADLGGERVDAVLLRAAAPGGDPVARATALSHLGAAPSAAAAAALLTALDEPAGPWRSDFVLAALAALPGALPAAGDGAADDDPLRATAAASLRASFDDPDIRIRLAAREAARATALLAAELIPTEGSLRATVPAFRRDPGQPALRRPFDAGKVRCVTPRGTFEITLDGEAAPNTAAMFRALAGQGFYEGLIFHRVVPDFVAQGGDPTGTGWGGPGWTIRSEWSRLRYERGAVGIAHSGKDTGGCQFFVTLSEQPHLNGRYTIFGHVTKGMDVVDRLCVGDSMRLEVLP